MISRVAAFALFVALAACAGPSRTSDDRMTPLVGGGEASLIAGMGRPPDAGELRTDDGARLLRWRRDMNYAVPNALLPYQYAGGTTRPIADSPFGIVGGCVVEWTVRDGTATGYRWTGFDCP